MTLCTESGDGKFSSPSSSSVRQITPTALKDVNRETLDDKMESFALAETLKYLYLLQDPDSDVDILNKHVFTTEAHVFKI